MPEGRLLPDAVLEALRLRAVRGCEVGHAEAHLSQLLGVVREAVCRWCSAYREGCTAALPNDRPVGTGRTLSDEQADQLWALIDQHQHAPEPAAPRTTRKNNEEAVDNNKWTSEDARRNGLPESRHRAGGASELSALPGADDGSFRPGKNR